VVRDDTGCLRLGSVKVTKKLFNRNGAGAERYAKSMYIAIALWCQCLYFYDFLVWQVLALIQRLLLEGKVATQREAYYCLVQHFKNQSEFNDTLQGKFLHTHTEWTTHIPQML